MNSLHNRHFPRHSGCTKTARTAKSGDCQVYGFPRQLSSQRRRQFEKQFSKELYQETQWRVLKEDQREKKAGCDQLCQPCAKNKMNSTAPSPGWRGALSSGHSHPTLCAFQGHHCCSSCNWVCGATEFQANLGKRVKTWYERRKRRGGEGERMCFALEKLLSSAQHFRPPVSSCGGHWAANQRVCAGTGIPLGSAHKRNTMGTVGILCPWKECLLSMINERITIISLGSTAQALYGAH